MLSFLGSIRPSARSTLYHPVCTAFCALVGVLLAASAGNLLIAIIGFLFIPKNNWLAGILFALLAAMSGWLQLVACVWGFIHFALDAIEAKGPAVADRALWHVRDQFCRYSASSGDPATRRLP